MSITSEDLLRFIVSRTSVRRFAPDPVPDSLVENAVRAALYAPRAGNQQHWRIIALRDRSVLDGAASLLAAELAAQRNGISSPRALKGFDEYTGYFSHFASAPLVLAVVCRPYDSIYRRILARYIPEADAGTGMGVLAEPALISASMAAQNLMLALHAQGIGSCYMTGPLVVQKAIEEALQVDAPEHVTGLVAAGFPEDGSSGGDVQDRRTEGLESILAWR
ncbi:MAG: nitroreductase family protein [Planctomycetes bacterium]|nr:nitroreductase family protein [Planctomycetota bacterium]